MRPKSRNTAGGASQTIPIKVNANTAGASGNKATSRSRRKLINAANASAVVTNEVAGVASGVKRVTP